MPLKRAVLPLLDRTEPLAVEAGGANTVVFAGGERHGYNTDVPGMVAALAEAGVTAPPGKKMGHAGAIVSGGKGTAAAKMEALADAGVKVGNNPTEAGELMAEIVAGL